MHDVNHQHECCHKHDHGNGCAHHHAHGHEGTLPAMSPEETMALLTYMLDHNKHHAEELHDIVHALEAMGKTEAAEKLAEAMHLFDHCNETMAEAVKLAKGEYCFRFIASPRPFISVSAPILHTRARAVKPGQKNKA